MTGPGLEARLIRDWRALRSLEPEWNALLRRSRADSVFLSFEWVDAWLDVTDRRREPFVIAVRDALGRVCGIAPFYIERYRLGRLVPVRTLRVVGDVATGAEYPDWIVDRADEHEIERCIVDTMRAHARHWDTLWLPNLSGANGAIHGLVSAFRSRGCFAASRPVSFREIALPDSLSAYEARLSRGRRQQMRRRRRQLLGRAGVSVVRCESGAELDAFLDALFDLHHRRWMLRGDPGTFRSKPGLARFYRRFAPVALRAGWLRLYALVEHGEIRAVQLGYVYGGVFHQIQEGFDPDFTPGAGNVLRHVVIEACIAEGLSSYDFMAGDSEHKRRWGAEPQHGFDLFVGRPGLVTLPVFAAGVWPTGRFLRPVPPRAAVARSDHASAAAVRAP